MYIELQKLPESTIVFHFKPDSNDYESRGVARLANTSSYFKLPVDLDLEKIHADVLALAALMVVSPWSGREIELSWCVSEAFAESVFHNLKRRIGPVNLDLAPRTQPDQGESSPGLAFSGGVDSFAQLLIMPEHTVSVFAHRIPREGDIYTPEAALNAIDAVKGAGGRAVSIETDMEYVRNPVGFSTDPMPGVPAILLADHFSLDSIAYGTISNAAYGLGKGKFVDYTARWVFRAWQSLLKSVGLEYYNAVSTLSELGTMEIVQSSPFSEVAESCVRGTNNKPCLKCVKCFRKQLMRAYVDGHWPSDVDLASFVKSAGLRDELVKLPIRQEFIYKQVLSTYTGDSEVLQLLKSRVDSTAASTSFADKIYRAGFDAVTPERYRHETWAKLTQFVTVMTSEDEEDFKSFDLTESISDLQKSEDFEVYTSTMYLLWALLKFGDRG